MYNMPLLLLYVFIYCNADFILDALYLSKYNTETNNELIQDNPYFYYSIINIYAFALFVNNMHIIKHTIKYNSLNNDSIALSLIYMKYTTNILLTSKMTICQYEFSRNVMWLFATPLMIKMYCDVNRIKMQNINLQWHLIPVIINIINYQYKNTILYYAFTSLAWIIGR